MNTRKSLLALFLIFLVVVTGCTSDSQLTKPEPESEQEPEQEPEPGSKLVVLVDEAHNNYHRVNGRYAPFATLLENNGYDVRSSNSLFNEEALKLADVLVISNALADRNVGNWSLPTPSAFSNKEIETVRTWVDKGGSLLLIADHMPFPGAAAKLAAAFGVNFNNGFAYTYSSRLRWPYWCLRGKQIQIFRRSNSSLVDHPITRGLNTTEQVDSVATFTGQAFQADTIQPLLVFGPTAISLMPEAAWEFSSGTPQISVDGWFQGAVKKYGGGRAAFFGEAAMFTEQNCEDDIGRAPMGMNAPEASQDARFVLNLFHWLTDSLENVVSRTKP